MKNLFLAFGVLCLVQISLGQNLIRKEIYSWVSIEVTPKDSRGQLIRTPKWDGPNCTKPDLDSFYIYSTDSIRMFTADAPKGTLFEHYQLNGYKWKPKPQYYNKLFFVGLFTRQDLGGMIITIYATKDWTSLLEILYTNPGNMNGAILFSKNSENILKDEGLLIDPAQDIPEPEKLVPVN